MNLLLTLLLLVPAPHFVTLKWNAVTGNGPIRYNLYRSNTPAGPFKNLNNVPMLCPSYGDWQVTANGSYWYEVTAVDENGLESAKSAPVTVKVP